MKETKKVFLSLVFGFTVFMVVLAACAPEAPVGAQGGGTPPEGCVQITPLGSEHFQGASSPSHKFVYEFEGELHSLDLKTNEDHNKFEKGMLMSYAAAHNLETHYCASEGKIRTNLNNKYIEFYIN